MSHEEIVIELRVLNSLLQEYRISQDDYTDKAMELVAQLGEEF